MVGRRCVGACRRGLMNNHGMLLWIITIVELQLVLSLNAPTHTGEDAIAQCIASMSLAPAADSLENAADGLDESNQEQQKLVAAGVLQLHFMLQGHAGAHDTARMEKNDLAGQPAARTG